MGRTASLFRLLARHSPSEPLIGFNALLCCGCWVEEVKVEVEVEVKVGLEGGGRWQ